MSSETEIWLHAATYLCSPAVGIVIIAGLHCARAVRHFANRSEMVACVIVVGRTDLHSLRIETFSDVIAPVALLRRLRDPGEAVVYAPQFRRDLEEPIAGAIAVPRRVPLIVTEGNYLLLDDEPWSGLFDLLDEVWYLDPGEELRLERLIARHVVHGKTPDAARAWSLGSDQRNAGLVRLTRDRADRIIRVAGSLAE